MVSRSLVGSRSFGAVMGVAFAVAVLVPCVWTRAQPAAELPTDPTLVKGELDNGLTYIVKQHSNPPGRVSMYMHVSSGSLNEKDDQRGLAHYLEHLAFNGSKNFPPGSVVPFFESLGLTFGQHQNAFTSFDQTTYVLDLPDTKAETLGKGMLFFSDIASRLLLEPKEIDDERQVILEERRSGLGAQQRMMDYIFERLAPGSLLGERLPIGTEATINGADQAKFRDYVSRWYVPSNITVMVVGDMPAEAMVEQIKANFAGGERVAKPVDQDMRLTPSAGMRGIVATDPELRDAEIGIVRIDRPRGPVDTEEEYRVQLVESLGEMIHNRRMEAKVAESKVRFLRGYAYGSDLFQALEMTQVSTSGEPAKWKEMLEDAATELQRSRAHGFTERELDDVKRALASSAEQAVKTESTRPASAVLGVMNFSVAAGTPIMSAQQRLDLYNKLLPAITVKEVSERFAKNFDMTSAVFLLKTPSGEGFPAPPTEDELVAAGAAALKVEPGAESESDRPAELMAAKPSAGKVVESVGHEASGVTSAWLENGVRVHHRFMDIRKDQVTITIGLSGGTIQETAANHGVTQAATLALNTPATSRLTSTNIRDLMTDKNVSVGGGPGLDVVALYVSGAPEDVETGLELAHLLLTDPVLEESAFSRWKTEQLQAIEARLLEPSGVLAETLIDLILPKGEVRQRLLQKDEVERLTREEAQRWLAELVRTAPIEVSVVGDLPRERAMELVRTYVGSLPARPRVAKETLKELRTIARPAGPLTAHPAVKTMTPQAIVMSGFFGSDHEELRDTRLLEMAARILSTRMLKELREKEQLVYSIGVQSEPGEEFPGYGMVVAGAPTEPGKADALERRVAEMYGEFAKSGPTDEEMTVAKTQIANSFAEQMPQPGFWTGKLSDLTLRGVSLDDVLGAPAAYQGFTAEEVRAAFARYCTAERSFAVTVKPETAGSATAPDAAKP